MRGLLSTAASRAWLGVAAVGVLVVALVIGLGLVPRLSAGQEVIDAAEPAMSDPAVAGEVAGTRLVSRYVDLADPLMTRKGGGAGEVRTLVTMIKRKTGVSSKRARALLRREVPQIAALLRALPLSEVARERGRLTVFLSTTLNITAEQLQDRLARDYPRLYQTLSELPSVTSGWYDVPGIEGMTLFDGTRVRTLPGVRRYLRDDLVATAAAEKDRFQALAGSGGVGYIPYVLLLVGIGLTGFGLLRARWAVSAPAGKRAWGFVVGLGVLIIVLVGALQYFPRLNGADRTIHALGPAFDERRVAGLRAGTDLLVEAVRFGDPIATPVGGVAAEVRKLVAFVAERTGVSRRRVRGRLRRAAPRTSALLEAIPLSEVADEVPRLRAVLSRKLRLRDDRLVAALRRRTPGLAQSLLAVGPVTRGWNEIRGTEGLKRFDGLSPVRSMPAFAEYLDADVVPVLESEQGHFDELSSPWPPVDVLPAIMLGVGLLLAIYATAMRFLVTRY